MEKEPIVIDATVTDDAALEQLGYQQELKRTFGLLGMIGFSFSLVTSWTALGGVLIVGVQSGGPPVMVWSWVGISILAPPKWARGLSYICGWFMLTGILVTGAVNNFIAANFIFGMANLSNPNYTIERWHTVLVSYLICLLSTIPNIWAPHLLDRMSRGMLIWNIVSFIVIVITILVCNDHKQPASFVFKDFQNLTGFNMSYTAVLGILQSAWGMCCYDGPSHMIEELKDARKQAPKAIVMSIYIGAITGFIFLIAVCFCIGDIETTATSATSVPLIQIFYDSTGSVGGACVLTSLITVIVFFCTFILTAEGSRAVYAFARDRGLPFSGIFSKVESRRKVPVYATLLTAAVQIVFDSIYLGTVTGFYTVISVATEGFYLSYAMPLFVRILARLTGKRNNLEGPYSLGRYGLLLNVVGFLFIVFVCITFNFPTLYPVNSENMNYISAAIGGIMFISIVTWLTTGRKQFTGPEAAALVIEGTVRMEGVRTAVEPGIGKIE